MQTRTTSMLKNNVALPLFSSSSNVIKRKTSSNKQMRVVVVLLITLSIALGSLEQKKHSQRRISTDKPLKRQQNLTQCIYQLENTTIACKDVNLNVCECPVFFEWPILPSFALYKIFGLDIALDIDVAKKEPIKFRLYPWQSNNSKNVDHTIININGIKDIFIYYGDKFVDYGFRISEFKCYQRLVDLIRGSSVQNKNLTKSDLNVQLAQKEMSMIGQVLIFDKETLTLTKKQRWLFGGFPIYDPYMEPYPYEWPLWNPLFPPCIICNGGGWTLLNVSSIKIVAQNLSILYLFRKFQ
jgi:hypothetical protein